MPYRRHLKKLEAFHTNCLQCILGLKWWHRVPHNEIRRRTQLDPLEIILTHRQLRWLGHTIRMPAERLPHKVLYGELAEGRRNPGGPRKRFKDQLKTSLKKCGIESNAIEHAAADRRIWRNICQEGLETFTSTYNDRAERRRHQRHAAQRADGIFPCAACGRVCNSRIGLHSHQRVYQA